MHTPDQRVNYSRFELGRKAEGERGDRDRNAKRGRHTLIHVNSEFIKKEVCDKKCRELLFLYFFKI